ncbi:hypothetical protein CLV78_105261 [Aliiruegeria haliotis]|uniref:Uncharacterized protein n=1 Tax=Aliiruegeria haliotis TaxID=1280846 RepID=A0A2T0RPU2_9RHOB|nr:hypothetical protein [Aliiruegeria haliotis]PRY23206.1 hypothetical protein CLV78_105261 [Aliiruegeria haliotis]
MELVSDVLMISGALVAALYCLILSRRLTQFTDLEKGMGGAVAVLSVQVDDLKSALERAEASARASERSLKEITHRAEAAAAQMEMLLASMHDMPDLEGRSERGPKVRRHRRSVARTTSEGAS